MNNDEIITKEEIKEIIKKYNIGKKTLSLVLGFGEVTITRYLNGSKPSKNNSILLKNILNNPFLFEMYLIVNKDKISNIAFRKSLSKTKQVEFLNEKSKIYNVSMFIISKLREIDFLSIHTLLYFSQCFSKCILGYNIFEEEAECWECGPIYLDIYDCFLYYKNNSINYDDLLNNETNLNDNEKEYLNYIINYFGLYSSSILKEMVCLTKPYFMCRNGIDDKNIKRRIELIDINSFFKDIYSLNDIEKYSNYLFKKAKKLLLNNN